MRKKGSVKKNKFSYVVNEIGQLDYVLVDIVSPKYGFLQMKMDIDDLPLLDDGAVYVNYKPCIKVFYAIQKVDGKTKSFHRRLFPEALPEQDIMHLNDTLDNRRDSLKIGSRSENMRDQKKHREGKLVGVSFHKYSGRWMSRICIKGKLKHIGYYKSELEAHQAFLEYEKNCKEGL